MARYVGEDVQLNEENCYETIPGVANLSSSLCPHLPPDSGAHLLNLFSTVDHSSYCLAHVWTYRSLVSTQVAGDWILCC